MRAAFKAIFLAILCAAVGLVLSGGRVSFLPLTSIRGPIASQTANSSKAPDQAVRDVLTCLHDNRPDVLWNSLPASYQRDVTAVVHEFVAKVPPDIWSGACGLLRKGPPLTQAAKKQLASVADGNGLKFTRIEIDTMIAASHAANAVLESFTTGNLEDQKFVQTTDFGRVVRPILARIFPALRATIQQLPAESPFDLFKGLHRWHVEILSQSGDEATVRCQSGAEGVPSFELQLVELEGKWIPKDLSDSWPTSIVALRDFIRESEWTPETQRGATQIILTAELYVSMATTVLQSDAFRMDEALRSSNALSAFGLPADSLLLLGYLLNGPPMVQPVFTESTQAKLRGRDKITLVMCHAPTELKWDNEAVDVELARYVAQRLGEHDINIVDPDRLQHWLEANKTWQKAVEVGEEFKVDYIIHIELKDYSLFEEHTSDLYRGRGDALVTVIQMDEEKRDGSVIFSREINWRYPLAAPISVYQQSYNAFKHNCLSTLAEEIGKLFYGEVAAE